MKYIKTYEESIQLKLWDDLPIKYKNETVFHNNNWLVIKPKKFETLLELSEGTEWSIQNINAKYHVVNNFKPQQYKMNDSIYVNINKKNNEKVLFDFYKNHFYDNDEEDIYLSEFFNVNNDLFNFYGEIVECSNVVKKGSDYWIVVSDNAWFADFYKEDPNTRKDFIKSVLSGDAFDIFEYYGNVDLDQYGLELDDDGLILMKCILFFEKENNDYDYDIEDITDYSDVLDVVKENDIDDLKSLLTSCVTRGKESADESQAFEDVANEYYEFFGLVDGSAKWGYHNSNKSQDLFIKFKSNENAYYAKFRINEYDESYEDDLIDYSPPYNGYSGDYKIMSEVFNSELIELFSEYYDNNEEIYEYYELWKDIKKENPKIEEEEIIEKIKLRLDSKKFNL